jgi:hypothetical protein
MPKHLETLLLQLSLAIFVALGLTAKYKAQSTKYEAHRMNPMEWPQTEPKTINATHNPNKA